MLRTTLFAAVLALTEGCANMHIHAEVAPQTDLSRYRSFAWVRPDHDGPETIVDQRVRIALRGQLEHKGFVESTPERADFLVRYHVLQERKLGVADWGNGIYGWSPDVEVYSDGALIVDFVDPCTNRIFWRSSASSAIEPPGLVDPRRLEAAASKMVARYPLPSGSDLASAR